MTKKGTVSPDKDIVFKHSRL